LAIGLRWGPDVHLQLHNFKLVMVVGVLNNKMRDWT